MPVSSLVTSPRTTIRRSTVLSKAISIRRESALLALLFVVFSPGFLHCAAGVKHHSASAFSYAEVEKSQRIANMAPKSNDVKIDGSSSVLGELKETIQRQAMEIEQLRGELKTRGGTSTAVSNPVSHGGGGGHGAGEVSADEVARYLHDPFYRVALQRVGWLGIFLTSLSATALIMNVFEETLEKHIELSYFVPLLAGHGGNTGGQAVGTVLSALSSGTVKPSDAPRVILKEAMAGILSGAILGSAVSPIAYKIMGLSFHVAVVLFFTIPLVSMIASTLGSLIPFACVAVGLDPSVIAAPAMTSTVDVIGLMSYFTIANYIFRLYGLEL